MTVKAVPALPLTTLDGRIIKMAPGPCLWCKKWVIVGREEAGSTNPYDPAWMTMDGDYGCAEAPEAHFPYDAERGDSTSADHARPYDLARLILRPALANIVGLREAIARRGLRGTDAIGMALALLERCRWSGHMLERRNYTDPRVIRLTALVESYRV